MRSNSRLLLVYCVAIVVAGVILGGATRPGYLGDALLQLGSIPLLLLVVGRRFLGGATGRRVDEGNGSAGRRSGSTAALVACCALAAIPALQLIPLPASLWSLLTRDGAFLSIFQSAGPFISSATGSLKQLSITPNATLLALLSLIPPVAVFLATLTLSAQERRRVVLCLLAIGAVSVLIGVLQVAQGPASPLRIFDVTNRNEAVGFFANRNHFSALLYVLLIFATALAVDAAMTRNDFMTPEQRTSAAVIIGWFTLVIVLIAAQALARSRAGLGLTILGLIGCLTLALADGRSREAFRTARLLAGAMTVALVLSSQFVLFRVMERFTNDPLSDARVSYGQVTIEAAKAFMPWGSGIGSFVPVFAALEKSQDAIPNIYANQAHNDLLQLWLEAGIPGLVLMALFIVWFLVTAIRIWRRAPVGMAAIDYALMRGATIAIALVLLHSLVDYPLRTAAMMIVAALCCGMLFAPTADPADAVAAPTAVAVAPSPDPVYPRERAPLLQPAAAPPVWRQQSAPAADSTAPGVRRWSGADDAWPESWQKGSPPAAKPPVRPAEWPKDKTPDRQPKTGGKPDETG